MSSRVGVAIVTSYAARHIPSRTGARPGSRSLTISRMLTVVTIHSLPVLNESDFDERRRSRIAADLREMIEGEVRFTKHERLLHATDASFYQVEPIGVVVPRSMTDVERVVQYCSEHRLPILPRGGGTSLAGQAVNIAVMIDFAPHCREVLEIDSRRRRARIEPGVVLAQLNQTLAPHGLMFGPDVATATHANLGGMIGNNSSGAHSVRYGRTVDHLIAMDVLLADGTRLTLDEGAAERDERVRNLTQRVADIVLPIADEIDQRYPRILRHVDGYNLDLLLEQLRQSTPGTFDRVNLAHLFCGSEGTLGVTLGATINLVKAPKVKGLAIAGFDTVDEALAAVRDILETNPAAVELLDDVVLGLAAQNTECRRYLAHMPRRADGRQSSAVLYVEYFTDDDDELRDCFGALERVLPNHPMRRFTDPGAMAEAWRLRAAGEPLLHGLPGRRKPQTFVEDAAVDPAVLPEFIRDFRALIERHGTTAAYYAHASVGCLHVRPLINLRDESDLATMPAMAEELCDLVRGYGGALSGEHGDGRLRSHLLRRFYGDEICDAFDKVKAVFDPSHLMNPGNIVGAPAMTEHLRTRPQPDAPARVPTVETYYRYEREHDLAGAVEMCNGAGVCRKMSGGTMCPSYRALRDERHATRGRANALRLAITGQFSIDGETPAWNDPDTLETLDLCLSCKACKSECPSNVDLAKLKAEYLAHRYNVTGRVPLATRVFANVRAFNRIGSMVAPVANALNRFPLSRMAANRALGLHPRRTLPRFEKSLYRWFASRTREGDSLSLEGEGEGGGESLNREQPVTSTHDPPPRPLPEREGETSTERTARPCIVLFPDCFTVYNEPAIGRAAVQVLEALGYCVILPRIGCCGRSMISLGLLDRALRVCAQTARELIGIVDEHDAMAIVGCEPSCVSAITDDWPDLKLDVDRAAVDHLASMTMLIEDFIARDWDNHPAGIARPHRPDGPPVLLHGHCHQKALTGLASSGTLLSDMLGERFSTIDSGCCGMAGAFGYTRDHYNLSMQIGELSVFPPLRDKPDAIVLAPGTSCRHQIHDALGRQALHPIELIRTLIASEPQEASTKAARQKPVQPG